MVTATARKKQQTEPVTITDADREEALAVIEDRHPLLCKECRALESLETAELHVRKVLHTDRVGAFVHDQPGEIKLATCDTGVTLERDERRGLLTWLEVAHQLRDLEEPQTQAPPANGSKPRGKKKKDTVTSTSTPAGIREHDPDALPAAETPPAEPPVEYQPVAAVPLELVGVVSNMRKHFDPVKLEELAASIRSIGILHPLVARALPSGRFALVAGERRLRAAALAGLATVPIRAGAMSDRQAAAVQMAENLQDESLTPIEEAAGFQAMLAEHGYSQVQLAATLGCTQGHISNRLRLLKLPQVWQQRVISGEIPSGHARHLVKFAEVPAMLKAVERDYFGKNPEALGNDQQFKEALDDMLPYELQQLVGDKYEGRVGKRVPYFVPTEVERKLLDVVEIDGKEYARNQAMWDKLRAKQLGTVVADKPTGKAQGAPKETKLSPAQQKAKEKKQAEQLQRFVAEWRTNWLCYLLARQVIGDFNLALKTLLLGLTFGHNARADRDDVLAALETAGGPRLARREPDAAQAVAACQPAELLLNIASEWLWADDGPRDVFGPEAVEALAVAAEIDLAAEWKADLAGPLTEALFNRHSREGLVALNDELGVWGIDSHMKKGECVGVLLNSARTREHLPAAIKPVKLAQAKPSKAASKKGVPKKGAQAANAAKKKPTAKGKAKGAAQRKK